MYKNKKHLFFDLDHTLWDFDTNSALAFRLVFEKHQIPVDCEAFITYYLPINQKYWKLYQVNQISHEHLRYYRLKDVFDALNYPISSELLHIISEDYIEYLPKNNHLLDGAIEILDYLHSKYKLHIITNGFAKVQAEKIKKSNLEPYFATITNSEMAGEKKPHQHIFNYALQAAKASKEESVMIGDSYEADVLGAINAGINAIFYSKEQLETAQNTLQINHLKQLKNIF